MSWAVPKGSSGKRMIRNARLQSSRGVFRTSALIIDPRERLAKGLSCVPSSLVLVTILFLVVACGGGGGDSKTNILHVKNQDISEDNLRAVWRASLINNLVGGALVCKQLEGLTPEGVINFFRSLPDTDPNSTPVAGATYRPGQAGDGKDLQRAATIFQEECEHTFPG